MTPWAHHVFIIAEAGVNHNGDLRMAEQLIEAAADAGADAVKFQTFRSSALVTATAPTADYQRRQGQAGDQQSMLAALELDAAAHRHLQAKATECGIRFMSTAFDPGSIDLLHALGLDCWKIPSGEITNYPYLCRIAAECKPTILSTGMATLAEVDAAVQCLLEQGLPAEYLAILHCTTEYPAPWSEVNLQVMPAMARHFQLPVGYSDHTAGIEVSLGAVALGARVIEKHLTLDRNLPGPDHQASIEPAEFKALVAGIRHLELALGSPLKQPTVSELKNRTVARKSIVAATFIPAGTPLTEQNLAVKRPGTGMNPMAWPHVLGRCASRDYQPDELIDE